VGGVAARERHTRVGALRAVVALRTRPAADRRGEVEVGGAAEKAARALQPLAPAWAVIAAGAVTARRAGGGGTRQGTVGGSRRKDSVSPVGARAAAHNPRVDGGLPHREL